jgi:hypothetical protein
MRGSEEQGWKDGGKAGMDWRLENVTEDGWQEWESDYRDDS